MSKKTTGATNLTLKEKLEIIKFCTSYPDVNHTRVSEIFTTKFSKTVCRRSIRNYIEKQTNIKKACSTNI